MLLATFTFDKNNPNWTNNHDCNMMFLRATELHLNAVIQSRGYVYKNQIFEQLGLKWNPEDENPCLKYVGVKGSKFVEFEVIRQTKAVILVNIICRE